VDTDTIRAKFGDHYLADDRTFTMGIDIRLTSRVADRFRNRRVLETCTGAGFTTIALARVATHVTTVEVAPAHQSQARYNVGLAGLSSQVTFIAGDVLDEQILARLPRVDASFMDPDWAVTGPAHVHRFLHSTMRPPADALLDRILRLTPNAALVLPPQLDIHELDLLPSHERQKLFLGESHELYCLWFGDLAAAAGETELHA
jgi:hypothetical protein